MKRIHHILAAVVITVFISSCASQKDIQLVGHYKPNTEVSKAQSTTASQHTEQIAVVPEKSDMQALASTKENAPDLKLSQHQFQQEHSQVVLTQKQQAKAGKLYQKIETKIEKNTIKQEQQSLQSQNSSAMSESSEGSDLGLGWLILFAIILPPLAVGLAKGIGTQFWISIILTLLFWIPGVIYALIVILD